MKSRRRFRPRFDLLEDRLAPACSATLLEGDTLQVVGDDGNQIITITYDDLSDDIRVRVDCNGDGDATDAGEVNNQDFAVPELRKISVSSKGGADSVRFVLDSAWALVGSNKAIYNFKLGGGNDTFTFDADQHDLGNGELDVNVTAGGGNDRVVFEDFRVIQGTGNFFFNSDLGNGNDTYSALFDRATFDMNLDTEARFQATGGDGDDSIRAASTGSGEINVQNNAVLQFFFFGNAGNDTLSVSFSSADEMDLDGVLKVFLDGGTKNDILGVNLQLKKATLGSNGTLDVDLLAQDGDDVLALTVASDPQVAYTGNAINLNGGLGIDDCNVNTSDVPSGVVKKISCET
jgi:hypothetical protein